VSRILITPRSLTQNPDPALQLLVDDGYELVFSRSGEMPDEAALLELLPGCVGWLAGVEPVSPRVLEAAPGLRAISRNGTGSDNLPIETADRLGIQVLRASGANARGVAELALGLILASLRHVPEQSAALKAGSWQRRPGIEIEDRTLGLIGCGAVGRLVARFGLALDARVRVFDPILTRASRRLATSPGCRSNRCLRTRRCCRCIAQCRRMVALCSTELRSAVCEPAAMW